MMVTYLSLTPIQDGRLFIFYEMIVNLLHIHYSLNYLLYELN